MKQAIQFFLSAVVLAATVGCASTNERRCSFRVRPVGRQ